MSHSKICVRLSTYDSRNAIDKVTSQLNAFDYDPSKNAFGPGRRIRRDGAEEEKAKEEEAKEIRAATTGSRGTALGRSARVHDDTRSRSVRSQDRGTRTPAGRSARTTTSNIARKAAVIARERADIRETADIATVEEEADGKEVEGAVAETIRGKTISDGTIEGTIGRNIAGTNGGETIGATIE